MLIADTHVHFYPYYDTGRAFNNLLNNLNALDKSAEKAVFLAERSECCFFSDLKEGRITVPDGFVMEETGDDCALRIVKDGQLGFYLFGGRQIVTAERLEVLSLVSSQFIGDGSPINDVVKNIEDCGAVPVLTWALGKWLLGRRQTVMKTMDSFGPRRLVIGDSFMRPEVLPDPYPLRYAVKNGFTVIAGSDPLPFQDEEQFMGRYASVISGEINRNVPAESVRRMLRAGAGNVKTAGARSSLLNVLIRQFKL